MKKIFNEIENTAIGFATIHWFCESSPESEGCEQTVFSVLRIARFCEIEGLLDIEVLAEDLVQVFDEEAVTYEICGLAAFVADHLYFNPIIIEQFLNSVPTLKVAQ